MRRGKGQGRHRGKGRKGKTWGGGGGRWEINQERWRYRRGGDMEKTTHVKNYNRHPPRLKDWCGKEGKNPAILTHLRI